VGAFNRDGVTFATCLISFLPGRLLAQAGANDGVLQSLGAMLARVDRALQGYFHSSLQRRLVWDVRRLPELAEFTQHIESQALRAAVSEASGSLRNCLPRLRALRSQAIHGDCHAANLLLDLTGRGIGGILDFGDMIHAPRIFEPAVTMAELLSESVATLPEAAAVLTGYALHQPLEVDEVEVLYDIIAARLAVTVLVHAWRRRHGGRGERTLDQSGEQAGRSLQHLLSLDRAMLTRGWHEAARTGRGAVSNHAVDPARRARLMGAGAELFYEKPLHLVRGSGVWMYDPEGRSYLDVYNNVPHVGHAHPAVVAAIQAQTAILATHTRYLHNQILEYAEALTARLPAHLDACIFVNSGSEANDVAWRMAQMASGHRGGLIMEHAYHGITDAVAALTQSSGRPHDPRVTAIASPPAHLERRDEIEPGELMAAIGQTDLAIATLRERGLAPAAFYIDTAITSSGIFDPPPAWAAAVTGRMRAAGALIVADEVQYGLGRCGSHFWGFERRGIDPDIVTLGKPVANGYPMGVVIANRALVEAFQAKFGFFSTFGGNAVAASAALAVLEVLDREALVANALETGRYFREQLQAVAARHTMLGQVRGAGLLLGVEVLGPDTVTAKRRAKFIINTLAATHRILIGYEGPHGSILKLRPPMPFMREHVDLTAAAIEAAASALASSSA
jgi:4-aminobutyrate aminotransferase-like enzyme